MTRTACLLAVCLTAHRALAQTPPPPAAAPASRALTVEQQVASAVLPLPAEQRAGAAVLGYGADGRLTRLREGSNHLVCLADNPREGRFHVACYHDSLEPYMARGRELRAQGVPAEAVDSVRGLDVAAGRIRMPSVASLYSLTGDSTSYDAATNVVRGGRALFVIYVPFATELSTGLSLQPRRGAPWLMHPGTPGAHIMLAPGM